MSPAAALGTGLGAATALMTLVWAWSVRSRDASLVDRFWGPGFVLVAWAWFALMDADGPRAWVLCAMVTAWGARLGWHITRRNAGHGEDPRYAAMRARSPGSFPWTSLVTVFWLQAAILTFVALPLHAALGPGAPAALQPLDFAGIALWLAGLVFEAVGDAQLAAFKRDPAHRGRVMDRGLWAWTRHPNYFGDATLWWGFGLFALATPGAWWTLAGPLLMTVLLVRVSGVSLLEQHLAARPGWAEYARRTSAFLPLPPRR